MSAARPRQPALCRALTRGAARAVGTVYAAEFLNRQAAAHWQEFAGQNYFDKHGVFVSLVFCAPLLAAAFVILINALRATSRLLIEVKKRELKSKAAKKKKEKKED